jgi:hypothetical protein
MSRHSTPEWIARLPEDIANWTVSNMDPDRFGLFRPCADAEMPFAFPSSAVSLAYMQTYHSDRLASLVTNPGVALAETAEYVRDQQQADSGFFIDPYLDPNVENREQPGVERDFRRALTKYTLELLSVLDSEPRYPYTQVGGTGLPDGDAIVTEIKNRDWTKPWGAGSHAAGMARELLYLVEEGHEEYKPHVEEAITFILAQQNPETGMWGPSSIPLCEQVSGALKVLGRFVFYFGMPVRNSEQLADSCIKHHADGGFYTHGDNMCFPRNVAEMCVACMVTSEYRHDELMDTLASVAEFIGEFRQPDGAFASDRQGMQPIGWCGASITGPAQQPRSDQTGTQAAIWSLGMIARHLDWPEVPWVDPQGDWRERVAKLRHRVVVDDDGRAVLRKL